MIHNKFRYILTLVALFAISTGAWAQEEVLLTTVTPTSVTTYSQSPDGIVTVTLDNITGYSRNFGWLAGGSVTVEAPQGYTITRCVFKQNAKTPVVDDYAPFTATIDNNHGDYYVYAETSTGQAKTNNMDGITSIEVYGYLAEPPIEVTPVAEPAANTKQWTFAMPGSDVVLTPVYYPGMLTLPASLTGGKLEVVGLTGPFTKLEVLDAWKDDNTLLSAANLPGLKEMTDDEAKNWTDVPSGYAILIYGFDGTKAKTATYIEGEIFGDPSSEDVPLSLLKTASADAEIYYPSEAQLPAGFEQDGTNIYVADKTEFKVKATPADGFHLASLMFGETDVTDQVDADGIATLTMPEGNADITLTATFSNEYTVALNAEGLSDEEAANWKAATGDNDPAAFPLENVKYGTEVKVTYTGTRKVIGVKAEKKAAAAAGIVNPVVGQVIGSDGNNYDANATLPDGVTKVAMIAYVSGSNGLALALTDEDVMTWDNSAPSNKGKTAPEICSALNTSKPVTGGTWKLPSKDEWKQMFSANGGYEGSYTGLNTALGNAGGTALMENEEYWSSSEVDDDAWLVNLADGTASWDTYGKHYTRCVRACLAF